MSVEDKNHMLSNFYTTWCHTVGSVKHLILFSYWLCEEFSKN